MIVAINANSLHKAIGEMNRVPNFQQLTLDLSNGVDAAHYDRFRDKLKNSTCVVERIVVIVSKIESKLCESLRDGLRRNTSLQSLTFRGYREISKSGLEYAAGIAKGRSQFLLGLHAGVLRTLDITHVKALVSAWKGCIATTPHQRIQLSVKTHKLNSPEMFYCGFNIYRSVQAFKDAISDSRWKVHTLKLEACEINDKTIEILSSCVHDSAIKILGLGWNNITDYKPIIEMVSGSRVQELDLCGNPVADNQRRSLSFLKGLQSHELLKVFLGNQYNCFYFLANKQVKAEKQGVPNLTHFGPTNRAILASNPTSDPALSNRFINLAAPDPISVPAAVAPLLVAPTIPEARISRLRLKSSTRSRLTNNQRRQFVKGFANSIQLDYLRGMLFGYFERVESDRARWGRFFISHLISTPFNITADVITALAGVGLAATGVGVPFTLLLIPLNAAFKGCVGVAADAAATSLAARMDLNGDVAECARLERVRDFLEEFVGNDLCSDIPSERSDIIRFIIHQLGFLFHEQIALYSKKPEYSAFGSNLKEVLTGDRGIDQPCVDGSANSMTFLDILLRAGIRYEDAGRVEHVMGCTVNVVRPGNNSVEYEYFTNASEYGSLWFKDEAQARAFMTYRESIIALAVQMTRRCDIDRVYFDWYDIASVT